MSLPLTSANAPRLIWMPFWAMKSTFPSPVTVLSVIVTLVPEPFATIPPFWYAETVLSVTKPVAPPTK